MVRQIVTRLAAVVPILFGVSVFIFLLMHLAPGDVTDALLGPMATGEAKEKLRKAMGLDRPLVVQYLTWMATVNKALTCITRLPLDMGSGGKGARGRRGH